MEHHIIAIDPGLSTGLVHACVMDNDQVEIVYYAQEKLEWVDAATMCVAYIKGVLPYAYNVTVVCEQFDLRPGNKFVAELSPVRISAAIQYAVQAESLDLCEPIMWQTPAQAKRLVSNEVLKNLGWYLTGKDVGQPDANDVRDAFRHLVHYLVVGLKHTPTIEAGWPK